MFDGRDIILATVKETVSLTAIDAGTGEIAAVAVVGTPQTEKPHEFALTADGRFAFVTLYGSADYGRNVPGNRVAIVDMRTFAPAGHIDLGLYRGPHSICRDADGMLWVTVEESQSLVMIDPATRAIERTVWTQVPVHWVTPAPGGMTLYCGHKQYPFISEVDAARAEVTARIALPVGSQALRVSPDGRVVYVGDFHRPLLHVIDTAARGRTKTVALTGVPGWPYPTPDGRHVVVTTYDEAANEGIGRGFVEILATPDLDEHRVVEVPGEPFHAHVTRDPGQVHVALSTGFIVTVDLETATLTGDPISTGGAMPEMIVLMEAT